MQGKLKRSLAIMAAAIVKICNAPNQVDHPNIEFIKFLKYVAFFFVFAPIILSFFPQMQRAGEVAATIASLTAKNLPRRP